MNTSSDASDGSSALQEAPFSVINRCLLVNLMDNMDQRDVERLEARLMTTLAANRSLRGVIFNFSEVVTTDPLDLQRLEALFQALKLLGARIGLCGINPGLATVMVHGGLPFERKIIGSDIDDLLANNL